MRGARLAVRIGEHPVGKPEARQLGVDVVLETSVVKAEGRTRMTVQLIDAATDLHIWVRRYDSAERDVIALHAALAQAVVRDVIAAGIGVE